MVIYNIEILFYLSIFKIYRLHVSPKFKKKILRSDKSDISKKLKNIYKNKTATIFEEIA